MKSDKILENIAISLVYLKTANAIQLQKNKEPNQNVEFFVNYVTNIFWNLIKLEIINAKIFSA